MAEKHLDETALASLQTAQLFVGPRPGKKSANRLAALDLTHCCTLLSEREDVQPVRRICQGLGCAWVWLPIEGGRLDILRGVDIAGHAHELAQQIAAVLQPRVYFHCSAGIHRTGFFVYVLLRLRGLQPDAARSELAALRAVTAEQVGDDRLALAEELLVDVL